MTGQISIGTKHSIEIGQDAQGRAIAKIFTLTNKGPKVKKAYWFRSETSRNEWAIKIAAEILENERSIATRKAEAKAAAKNHTVKAGDVFCHSWGYDQTNIDFYEVVSVRGQMLELRQTMQDMVERHRDGGAVSPKKGEFYGANTLKKRINSHAGTPYISMPYGWCQIWDNNPKTFTNYA